MNKLLPILALATSMLGCVSATVSDDSVCDTQSVSFALPAIGALPSGIPTGSVMVPSMTAPAVSEDFSSTLSKISDVVDSLSVSVNSITIDNTNHEFDWVRSLDIYIAGSGAQPMVLLASYTATAPATMLNVNVVLDPNTLLQYLSAGAVALTVKIGATTVNGSELKKFEGLNELDTKLNVCMGVSGSKSVSL